MKVKYKIIIILLYIILDIYIYFTYLNLYYPSRYINYFTLISPSVLCCILNIIDRFTTTTLTFILCLLTMYALSYPIDRYYRNKGVSIIALSEVTNSQLSVRNSNIYCLEFVFILGNDTIKSSYVNGCHYHKNKYKFYSTWSISYNTGATVFREYPKNSDLIKFGKFAFIDNKEFYTYHDYSLLNPNLVYSNVGYNIVYKAKLKYTSKNQPYLHFTELDGTLQQVKYKPNYEVITIDTFLVFKNINEKFEDTWHVCSPEINTPENWAKISDYGYIFHYDIYSKHEIEDSCQQIRNYVLKYKERLEKHL